jgi:predicted aspartyl protease
VKFATALSLVLGLYLAGPHPAHAANFDLTCNMASDKHSAMYHFMMSNNGAGTITAREASVWRDGSQITPNVPIDDMPTWIVVPNRSNNTLTLWSTADKGWALVISTSSSNVGAATIFTPSQAQASHGRCLISLPAPAPHYDPPKVVQAPTSPPAPAPAPAPTPAAGPDAVPFTYDNGAMFVAASIGGRPVIMQVDTGANVCTINEALADELIASGQAKDLGQTSGSLATGGSYTTREISVSMLVVGNHWGKDIHMTVMPRGTPLLSLPILLSSGNGKFTVDAVNRKIIFG